jgi:aryl sulfotransferase
MKILQIGYPESGNYWLYRILTEIKSAAGIKQESFIKNDPIHPLAKKWDLSYKGQIDIDMIDILNQGCFYKISSRYRNKIMDFKEYIEKTNHVWTHSNYCKTSKEVFNHFDRIIYLVRDPRDVALSTAKFAFTPYMQKYYPTWHNDDKEYLKKEFPNICKTWAQHVVEHLESDANIHYVFYERLLYDFDNELHSLLEHLLIKLSDEQKKELKKKVSLAMMKKANPGYVYKASLYGWKFHLNGWQKLECLQTIKPLLQYLNYPLSNVDDSIPFSTAIKPETISIIKRQLQRKSLNQRIKTFQEIFK